MSYKPATSYERSNEGFNIWLNKPLTFISRMVLESSSSTFDYLTSSIGQLFFQLYCYEKSKLMVKRHNVCCICSDYLELVQISLN